MVKHTNDDMDRKPIHRKPNEELVSHDRKRLIEVKCMELQAELEVMGVGEEDIEERVDALRAKLR